MPEITTKEFRLLYVLRAELYAGKGLLALMQMDARTDGWVAMLKEDVDWLSDTVRDHAPWIALQR